MRRIQRAVFDSMEIDMLCASETKTHPNLHSTESSVYAPLEFDALAHWSIAYYLQYYGDCANRLAKVYSVKNGVCNANTLPHPLDKRENFCILLRHSLIHETGTDERQRRAR